MYCPDTLFAFLFLFISITCFSLDCLLGTVSLLRCENKYTYIHTYIFCLVFQWVITTAHSSVNLKIQRTEQITMASDYCIHIHKFFIFYIYIFFILTTRTSRVQDIQIELQQVKN